MNMECRQVWELISEYIDRRLDPRELAEIDKHLENCEICSAILDSTRNILVLVADDRTFELPLGFSARLGERLQSAIARRGKT